MAKITSLKFPFEFDTQLLKQDLEKVLSQSWKSHYNSGAFSGDWSSVALLAEGGKANNIIAMPSGREPVTETEAMHGCDYFREVISGFQCPKTTVRLLRLGAGAIIKPHRDNSLGYEDGVFRVHIPVVTNESVVFMLAGERIVMEEGTCWYIDANEEHSVENRGAEDRIHLVLDCERNDRTDELFFAQAPEADFLSDRTPGYSDVERAKIIAELEQMGTPAAIALIEELRRKSFS
jgi:hypothetical protein